ncbi:MAG: lactonase family protein [Blastochloris sp.]|nr:lactonase family protein [Blastochloris sp.]
MNQSFDPGTGNWGPLVLAATMENPAYLALHPSLPRLYAVSESPQSKVSAYTINTNQTLTPLGERPSGGAAACHLSVDATGRFLFIAHYSSGTLARFGLDPMGALDESPLLFSLSGSGPHPQRQQKPHAHFVAQSPDNRFTYLCDLGSDRVWIFPFQPDSSALTPAPLPPALTPAGSGPRHLAFHPTLPLLYVNNELNPGVSVFSRDTETGALALKQTLASLPGKLDPTWSTAQIVCHPNGRWLYLSNRVHNSISLFHIATDGTLRLHKVQAISEETPRHITLDPSGTWLLCAGQTNHQIRAYPLHPESGELGKPNDPLRVPVPVCLLFHRN